MARPPSPPPPAVETQGAIARQRGSNRDNPGLNGTRRIGNNCCIWARAGGRLCPCACIPCGGGRCGTPAIDVDSREATTAAKERRPGKPDEGNRAGRKQDAGELAVVEGEVNGDVLPKRAEDEDAGEDDELIGGGSLGRRKAQ